jgi:hypothetical protein
VQIHSTALAALLFAACFGCATETQPQQPAAGAAPAAAAAPAPSQSKGPVYRTGSRLPPMDDVGGASSVSGVSKDDYMDDRNRTMSPTRGN